MPFFNNLNGKLVSYVPYVPFFARFGSKFVSSCNCLNGEFVPHAFFNYLNGESVPHAPCSIGFSVPFSNGKFMSYGTFVLHPASIEDYSCLGCSLAFLPMLLPGSGCSSRRGSS